MTGVQRPQDATLKMTCVHLSEHITHMFAFGLCSDAYEYLVAGGIVPAPPALKASAKAAPLRAKINKPLTYTLFLTLPKNKTAADLGFEVQLPAGVTMASARSSRKEMGQPSVSGGGLITWRIPGALKPGPVRLLFKVTPTQCAQSLTLVGRIFYWDDVLRSSQEVRLAKPVYVGGTGCPAYVKPTVPTKVKHVK